MTKIGFRVPHPRLFGTFGLLALVSCSSIDGFTSKPGYAYCGGILRSPSFETGFVPRGEPPALRVALTIDTNKLTTTPGILTSNDAQTGLCSANGQALFQDAPLWAIPAVDQDAVSQLSFGEGHQHDFFAFVDSSCQGTMVALVSLLKNNQVELRLFKPEPHPADDTVPNQPGFTMFPLALEKRATPEDTPEESKENCGF